MATNQFVNKVVFGNVTLMDTSGVTVTPDKLAEGYTAIDASGALITGTAKTGGNTVYYGECSTSAGTQQKVVTISGITELAAGLSIRVKFDNAQTYNGAPTLNLNSLGAKNIRRNGTTNAARYEWLAGEVLDLVYDGTAWYLVDGGVATTTYYGQTKLATSGTSTSTALALTPASLNNLAENMLSGVAVYSASKTYAVGDRVRYSYNIWECKTAITTAEAWNASHWTELGSLQEQIDEKADGTSVPTSASIDGVGLISFNSGNGTTLFSLQLPVFAPTAETFSFTIGTITYQAENGMTWAEWVNSEYNTDGYIISIGMVMTSNGAQNIRSNSNVSVDASDTISANGSYHLDGGSNE